MAKSGIALLASVVYIAYSFLDDLGGLCENSKPIGTDSLIYTTVSVIVEI
ncbi:hypothetical protein [Marinomonas foliarum]|uniref:Uncharacterized protein n=1 Tax=Marinomonas foliarum TaxID=491950 RepID=A0A368ZC22_9GAMM|nr:hypothetical protein [Marinomonas foliarum]RCW90500.1 hypothetical protein DFP77_1691 [Marinomonas foliarum]